MQMSLNPLRLGRRAIELFALGAAAAVLAGCTAKPTVIANELPFEQAVAEATDGLVAQTQKLPAFLAKVETKLGKRAVVLDPMLDSGSGQQTQATKLLEKRVSDRVLSKG